MSHGLPELLSLVLLTIFSDCVVVKGFVDRVLTFSECMYCVLLGFVFVDHCIIMKGFVHLSLSSKSEMSLLLKKING